MKGNSVLIAMSAQLSLITMIIIIIIIIIIITFYMG